MTFCTSFYISHREAGVLLVYIYAKENVKCVQDHFTITLKIRQ